MCLPLGAGVENVKDIPINKYEYGRSNEKLDFFVNYEKCREKSDFQSNAW